MNDEKNDNFLKNIKPTDYRTELIKYQSLNSQLKEKNAEYEGVIDSLKKTIEQKDVAIAEVSKGFEIEKAVNARMESTIKNSQTITSNEVQEVDNYEKAIEALRSYNKQKE